MTKNAILFSFRWILLGIIGTSCILFIVIYFSSKFNNDITESIQTAMHLKVSKIQSTPVHQMLDLLQSSFRHWNETNEYVAACLPVGNQQKDLREWLIHHYHHAGIRRFYIFDNNSKPPMHSLTNEQLGIPREAVTFVRNSHSQQVPNFLGWALTSCQLLFGQRHRWIAGLEMDEFLEVKNSTKSLETFLRPLEEYGGIGVQWKFYGSSGFLIRPKDGVRRSFYRCTNHTVFVQHIKTIWNTAFWTGYVTPHHFTTAPKRPVVNTRLEPIPGNGPFNFPLCYDHLVVHHYILKSKEEFDEKIIRGAGDGSHRTLTFFKDVDGVMNMECRDLMELNP